MHVHTSSFRNQYRIGLSGVSLSSRLSARMMPYDVMFESFVLLI